MVVGPGTVTLYYKTINQEQFLHILGVILFKQRMRAYKAGEISHSKTQDIKILKMQKKNCFYCKNSLRAFPPCCRGLKFGPIPNAK
jgi:hypothetical protein